MCMLPPGSDAERRQHFSALRQLLQNLNEQGAQLDTLSMGMSDDYPAGDTRGRHHGTHRNSDIRAARGRA
jgi:uncharacterized pyridoxal phosphate-containing UPF0001 family protein